MKKIIISAAALLALGLSFTSNAAPVRAGIVPWNSTIESPITACARVYPNSGPGYLSKYKEGVNGWFECYYY